MNGKWFLRVALSCFAMSIASISLAQTIADCTGIASDINADCNYMAQCKTTGACLPETFENNAAANYATWTNSISKGNCYNGYWDDGCVNCATMVCATGAAYSGIDAYGACTGFIDVCYHTCFNCCVG